MTNRTFTTNLTINVMRCNSKQLFSCHLLVAVLLMLLSCLPMVSEAQEALRFDSLEYLFGSVRLPYRKAVVNTDADANGRVSLVLYLHGGSSRGSDNTTQMNEKGIDSISNYLLTQHIPAVFLVPQCPLSASWGGEMSKVLRSLIDYCVQEDGIDARRIYLFGGSMGGTGTWTMVNSYPSLFAAAMPCAANPSRCVPEKVRLTPVYTVMGTADNIMSLQAARDFVNSLTALGGEAVMDEEEGWTHEQTCIESYTTQRLDWIFAQQRDASSAIYNNVLPQESDTFYSLSGVKLAKPVAKGVYVSGGRKIIVR